MRLLVCGDRRWENRSRLEQVLDEWPRVITTVIEGEAPGADGLARYWAESRRVQVDAYPAKWHIFGRGAGPIRNKQMLVEGRPEAVLAFHNTITLSRGTLDMLQQAERAGVPCWLATTHTLRRWQR